MKTDTSTNTKATGSNVEEPRKNGKICRSCGKFMIFKYLVRKMVDGKNTYEDWCKLCKHKELEIPKLKRGIRDRQLEKLAYVKIRKQRKTNMNMNRYNARKREKQAKAVLSATSEELEQMLRDSGVDV